MDIAQAEERVGSPASSRQTIQAWYHEHTYVFGRRLRGAFESSLRSRVDVHTRNIPEGVVERARVLVDEGCAARIDMMSVSSTQV